MLQEIFQSLLNTFEYKDIDTAWNNIHKNYTGPDRHYHNLTHLQKMYAELKEVKTEIQDWDALLISLFYHDVIYDSSAQNNELQSALFMEKELTHSQFINIEKCRAQIMATQKHQKSTCSDTNFLLDADLSILGSTWNEYEQYTQNVRQEYIQYPDKLYTAGRIKVLGHFLAMERVYKNRLFL